MLRERMSASVTSTSFTPQLVEHARALFDRSPLPLLATEGRAHVVQYVNPAFCWLVGQPADAVLGKPLGALRAAPGPAPDARAVALLDLVYATGVAEVAIDLARVFGNVEAMVQVPAIHLPCAVWPIVGGDERPVGLVVQISPPPGGTPAPWVDPAVATEILDVNARLVLAGLRAQAQADLEMTLRTEAEVALGVRDEFMSIAAHELRRPVTGIKASAQLGLRTLADGPLDHARMERYLHGVVGGANRLVVLINDLMDVSRMRTGDLVLRLSPVDLAALTTVVAQGHRETAADNLHLTIDVPGEPVVVSGDPVRLEQILDNLLNNAVKYSPAGGAIEVSLRHEGHGVLLLVADHGIGLPPGAEERIFEPFGRADNARRQGLPGMGLGLHICRQIAAAHGGRMWAASAGEGQGMAVSLWLPKP